MSMTVKHVRLSGEEDIYACQSVRFVPAKDNGHTGEPATLWLEYAANDQRPIGGGTAFVMNSNGKTVARYDMGGSPVPLGQNGEPSGLAA